jgi:hypothetical protein
MFKKTILIISLVLLTFFLSAVGLFYMAGYGGDDCDVTGKDCSCFCCHMFGLRGYESCGDFGLLVGAIIGIIISLVFFRKINAK